MYQLKIFTGPTPLEVEEQVNRWLKRRSELSHVRVTQFTATDVAHITSSDGIQRFTLVFLYEVEGSRQATAA